MQYKKAPIYMNISICIAMTEKEKEKRRQRGNDQKSKIRGNKTGNSPAWGSYVASHYR